MLPAGASPADGKEDRKEIFIFKYQSHGKWDQTWASPHGETQSHPPQLGPANQVLGAAWLASSPFLFSQMSNTELETRTSLAFLFVAVYCFLLKATEVESSDWSPPQQAVPSTSAAWPPAMHTFHIHMYAHKRVHAPTHSSESPILRIIALQLVTRWCINSCHLLPLRINSDTPEGRRVS